MPGPLIFDNFRSGLADNSIDWAADDIRSVIFLADTWTPDAGDQFVADATGAGAIEASGSSADRQALTTLAISLDVTTAKEWFQADPIAYPNVALATPFDTLIIFKFVTGDADSLMLMCFGLGNQVGDGADVDLTPEDGTIYAKL